MCCHSGGRKLRLLLCAACRFLLTVAPTNRDLPQSDQEKSDGEEDDDDEEEEASSSGSESESNRPSADVQITQISSDKALTKQDIMEKMNAMLAERRKSDDGLPSKVLAFKFSLKSEVRCALLKALACLRYFDTVFLPIYLSKISTA